MSLANFSRYQRALDGASGVILTAMGLLLTASMLFVGV
jgi:hypothetical protein